jgi:hypothetical protein
MVERYSTENLDVLQCFGGPAFNGENSWLGLFLGSLLDSNYDKEKNLDKFWELFKQKYYDNSSGDDEIYHESLIDTIITIAMWHRMINTFYPDDGGIEDDVNRTVYLPSWFADQAYNIVHTEDETALVNKIAEYLKVLESFKTGAQVTLPNNNFYDTSGGSTFAARFRNGLLETIKRVANGMTDEIRKEIIGQFIETGSGQDDDTEAKSARVDRLLTLVKKAESTQNERLPVRHESPEEPPRDSPQIESPSTGHASTLHPNKDGDEKKKIRKEQKIGRLKSNIDLKTKQIEKFKEDLKKVKSVKNRRQLENHIKSLEKALEKEKQSLRDTESQGGGFYKAARNNFHMRLISCIITNYKQDKEKTRKFYDTFFRFIKGSLGTDVPDVLNRTTPAASGAAATATGTPPAASGAAATATGTSPAAPAPAPASATVTSPAAPGTVSFNRDNFISIDDLESKITNDTINNDDFVVVLRGCDNSSIPCFYDRLPKARRGKYYVTTADGKRLLNLQDVNSLKDLYKQLLEIDIKSRMEEQSGGANDSEFKVVIEGQPIQLYVDYRLLARNVRPWDNFHNGRWLARQLGKKESKSTKKEDQSIRDLLDLGFTDENHKKWVMDKHSEFYSIEKDGSRKKYNIPDRKQTCYDTYLNYNDKTGKQIDKRCDTILECLASGKSEKLKDCLGILNETNVFDAAISDTKEHGIQNPTLIKNIFVTFKVLKMPNSELPCPYDTWVKYLRKWKSGEAGGLSKEVAEAILNNDNLLEYINGLIKVCRNNPGILEKSKTDIKTTNRYQRDSAGKTFRKVTPDKMGKAFRNNFRAYNMLPYNMPHNSNMVWDMITQGMFENSIYRNERTLLNINNYPMRGGGPRQHTPRHRAFFNNIKSHLRNLGLEIHEDDERAIDKLFEEIDKSQQEFEALIDVLTRLVKLGNYYNINFNDHSKPAESIHLKEVRTGEQAKAFILRHARKIRSHMNKNFKRQHGMYRTLYDSVIPKLLDCDDDDTKTDDKTEKSPEFFE